VRWTGEAGGEAGPFLVWRDRRLGYDDEVPGDRRLGVLWNRDRIGRNGEPQFAQLHSARQRQAMTRYLCQVCGETAVRDDGRVSWLVPPKEWMAWQIPRNLVAADVELQWVSNPPTCAACIPVALRYCPQLRSAAPLRISADSGVPVAVIADVYQIVPERALVARRAQVPLSDTQALRFILAKQLVSELHGVRIEALGGLA
jgi:hypothetical protein